METMNSMMFSSKPVKGTGVVRNEPVSGAAQFEYSAPHIEHTGTIRLLIVALDYERTDRPLTSTTDAANILELAALSGIDEVTIVENQKCTKDVVLQNLHQAASSCRPGDYFVFYYAGHGTSVKDTSNDEISGMDSAFVLVNSEGKPSLDTLLIDDVFSECLLAACSPSVRVLILTDCCHSGSIADLGEAWRGRQAVSMAGCMDSETSGDTGKGGIFTHAVLLALDRFGKLGDDDFSVGKLFNAAIWENKNVFHGVQHICIQSSPGFLPNQMAWPLIPSKVYVAPLNKHASGDSSVKLPEHMLQYSSCAKDVMNTQSEDYLLHVKGPQGALAKHIRNCRYITGSALYGARDGCALQ